MTNHEVARGDAASGNRAERRARASRRKRDREAPPANAFAYRVDDACAMGGFGRTTAYGLVKRGKLKLLRVGGRSLICGDSLRALLHGRD